MRRNNYTSAADRRWRRRYERLLQRKEEEAERQERLSSDAQEIQYILDGSASLFGMTEPTTTYTVPIAESDLLPNKNGTVIRWDAYGAGIHDGHRNVAESNVSVVRGGDKPTIHDDMYYEILKAWDDFISRESRQAELRGQGHRAQANIYDEWFGQFVDVKNCALEDITQEPDLEIGDNSMLDSFLEDFISPGA